MTSRRGSQICRVVIVAALAAWVGCFESESADCANGLACPPGTECAAAQDVCISDGCGNAIIESGEICDDGNLHDGDGCATDCSSDETCGNSIVDDSAGEVCDDGNVDDGDSCAGDCRSNQICGNGIVDVSIGEVCDDSNNEEGDGCSANCRSTEICGNLIVDEAAGEVCDDGNTSDGPCAVAVPPAECSQVCSASVACPSGFFCSELGQCDRGDGCSSDCRSGQGCGNGNRDLDEECDDGNTFDADNCTTLCVLNICGDGFRDQQQPRIEECDDGGESVDCDVDCTLRACGDGTVNAAAGEECDNVGAVDSASCDADCTVAFCGDLDTNAEAGEDCDEGVSAACDFDCTTAVCGDGIANPFAAEECDTGGASSTCDANCTIAFCGDSTVNAAAGEACDEGGFTATCDIDCSAPVCGDTLVNTAAGEECDDGDDTNPADGCNACRFDRCGDNIVKAPEVCDDGNLLDGDGCKGDCSKFEICGDGVPDANEQCDDGNDATELCDYGLGTCTVCGVGCVETLSTGNVCGDGDVDAVNEACDDGNANACGQCDVTCDAVIVPAAATGLIVAVRGNDLVDGTDTFTVDDGLGTVVTFEFDDDGAVTSGNVAIAFANNVNAAGMQDRVATAINDSALLITATQDTGAQVILTHQRLSSAGDVPIVETVADLSFTVLGMAGGASGDCSAGTGCTANDDCLSGSCSGGVCD